MEGEQLSPLTEAAQSMDKALEQLANNLEQLDRKLQSVMTPPYPAQPQPETMSEPHSAAVLHYLEQVARLSDLANWIAEVTGRLET